MWVLMLQCSHVSSHLTRGLSFWPINPPTLTVLFPMIDTEIAPPTFTNSKREKIINLMEVRGSGGGGCCIARYGTHDPYHLSKMDRIMLRFRPIAPKPVPGGGPPSSKPLNDDVKAGSGKGRKRSVSGRSGGGKRKKSRSPDRDNRRSNGEERCHVVTLPLLPETPDLVSPRNLGRKSSPTWLNFGGSEEDPTAAQVVVVSSVTVEGVTDTWFDGNALGRTDEERRQRLEEDACPGFISDGWNRVWWTNEAYRRMVVTGDYHPPEDTSWTKERLSSVAVVQLGMKEKVEFPAVKLFPAVTCRVRVQYGKDGSHSMTVPCDVWRLDSGGFAWRLDVKAALSLGR